MAFRKLRYRRTRLTFASSLAALILMAVWPSAAAAATPTTATPTAATPAAAVVPTVVTIEWHDRNADQINVLPILDDPARPMHATFLLNTAPIVPHAPPH